MTEESDKKGGFVVRDKRRFDAEGNERKDGDDKTKTYQAPIMDQPKAAAEQSFTMEPEHDHETEGEGVDFASFAMSLATQALMQLGEMQPPAGMELPVDREAAKQTIDILMMLKSKTKGNLSAVENKLMDDILHRLRLSYVRKV